MSYLTLGLKSDIFLNMYRDDYYYFNLAKEMILKEINLEKYAVFLFGSQVTKPISRKSDIDIGVLGHEKMPFSKICAIKEVIDESNVPFKVDIVDFYNADEEFKQVALKNIVIWNQPKSININ